MSGCLACEYWVNACPTVRSTCSSNAGRLRDLASLRCKQCGGSCRDWLPLHPEVGVEVSVADGFGEVFFVDRWFAGKIGDRSGNSQDFVVGSGGQAQ